MQNELAADQALQAGATEQCLKLLLESPVERRYGVHNDRNTPVTRPRIWTCRA
jgi:hypothetical protein